MRQSVETTLAAMLISAAVLIVSGCDRAASPGSLVLTQTPADAVPAEGATLLDERYPPGSRVILLAPPYRPEAARVLSGHLAAAGDPCVSWDGRSIFFAGKASDQAEWQIYRVGSGGGEPEQVTRISGGAMDPAVAAHDELVFSSPVPRPGRASAGAEPAALYGQRPGQPPRRLTFGPGDAVSPTVLRDGRILFVTAGPADSPGAARHLAFFTINNDGTEVTAYACQGDGAGFIRRPRELADGRIAFLSARDARPGSAAWAEGVQSSAPFETRAQLFAFRSEGCSSIEPAPEHDLVASLATRGLVGRSMMATAAVYRFAAEAAAPGPPLLADPRWNSIEATPVAARPEPAGHTTAVMPGASRGTMLCLNVNDSSVPAVDGRPAPAVALRVFTGTAAGRRALGQAPVAADGSVLVYLPVGVPLGFDTLDAEGRVLRHQPAFVWLQPGENRGCIGCHEPRNHSPRNIRPLAVLHDPAHLESGEQPPAPRAPSP